MAKNSKLKKLQKADAKVHKAKHKLHEKEEKLSEKEERLHKAAEKAERKPKSKVAKVMEEFSEGKLHSGSKKGPKVTSRKQAIAIGLSEARKAGEKVKPKSRKKKK